MRAHHFGGQEVQEGRLHALALQRVVAVRDPDPSAVREHAQIGAATAGGTGLDLQRGKGRAQLGQQRVQAQDMRAHARAPVGARRVREVAVHVPFEEVDGRAAQQRAELREQVRAHGATAEVEHKLVATQRLLAAGHLQHPVRVRAVQVAVGVHTFGFDPEAELHAQCAAVLGQWRQALRINVGRGPPVAQPGAVVAAATEPAVVEHEALDSEGGGRVGQCAQTHWVVVEVGRLPGVELHPPRPLARLRRQHARAHKTVPASAQGAQPIVTAPQVHGGRDVALPRGQQRFAGQQKLAELPLAAAQARALNRDAVVAGPGDLRRPGLAVAGVGAALQQAEPRIGVVRRAAGAGLL